MKNESANVRHPKNGDDRKKDLVFRGIGVAMGVEVGNVHLLIGEERTVEDRQLSEEEIPREVARFEDALEKTKTQIRELRNQSDPAVAGIFDAHLLILDDRPFINQILAGVTKDKKNVESVLTAVSQ